VKKVFIENQIYVMQLRLYPLSPDAGTLAS
jgi:hypothetical protein